MKKITLISTVLALSAMAFAESELSFSNKLYEEDAIIAHDDEADEDIKDFPGIKDKVEFEYKSDKVDAAVTAIFSIDDFNDKNFGVTGKIDDWFVEFRPVSFIGLALHESIVADAATLPIYDDNLSSGNIGSDGFTFIYKPAALNDAFTLAFTAPFGWDDEDEVNSEKVNWFKKSGQVNEDGIKL